EVPLVLVVWHTLATRNLRYVAVRHIEPPGTSLPPKAELEPGHSERVEPDQSRGASQHALAHHFGRPSGAEGIDRRIPPALRPLPPHLDVRIVARGREHPAEMLTRVGEQARVVDPEVEGHAVHANAERLRHGSLRFMGCARRTDSRRPGRS